jgi:ATP/maltotriose-dependent transcriptional regulator MalT
VGVVLGCLAQLSQLQDNLEEAQRILVESLAYLSDQEDLFERVRVMNRLSNVLSVQGNHTEARSMLYEALYILIERQHIPLILSVLLNMARLLSREDAHEQALKFVFFISTHPQIFPRSKAHAEQLFTEISSKLSAAQVAAAQADAKALTIESVVGEILKTPTEGLV